MTTVWTRDTKRRRVLSVLNISDSKRKSVLSLKTEETLEREEEGKEERVTQCPLMFRRCFSHVMMEHTLVAEMFICSRIKKDDI